MTDQHTHEILKDALSQQVLAHLGLLTASGDEQAQILAELGDAISDAVLVKVLEKVPETERLSLVSSLHLGDMARLQAMLDVYVGDMRQLVADTAAEEISTFNAEMASDEQQ